MSIMDIYPAAYFSPSTCYWVPDTYSRGSGEYCNAISKCTHSHSYTQKPHSYRWPITSVIAHWWSLSYHVVMMGSLFYSMLRRNISHRSEQKRKRSKMKIKSDTIMPCLGFSQQIAAIWRQWEWALSELSLKRFHSCYVFGLLSMKNNQSRGSVEDNVSDLWHKRMSVTGGLF